MIYMTQTIRFPYVPETNLPRINAYKFPLADIPAPTIKNKLFPSRATLRPYFSDGLLPIRQPIQAPKTTAELARDASA
jgi:hypothetical protein